MPLLKNTGELCKRIQDCRGTWRDRRVQGQLGSIVPLEPVTMPGRVAVQWDRDDCVDMGLHGVLRDQYDSIPIKASRVLPISITAMEAQSMIPLV